MKKIILMGIISLLILTAATLLTYDFLPAQMPIHWDLSGKADDYTDKNVFLAVVFAITAGINVLGIVLPRIDPRRANYRRFEKAYVIMFGMLDVMMLAFFLITLGAASRSEALSPAFLIPMALGIVFIVLGNYMPLFRQNFFAGIKTPWALADEEIWNRTHRIGGRCWFACGFGFLLIPFLPDALKGALMMILILIMTAVPFIGSYLIYHQKYGGKS
ncbi:MAG TPA: SdpI family protein [Candidatus Merdibacter merdavium]|uniref:SdpI family protein n=1 Tax=Candidatus Merdibacter merdavium TaxID=2838692 RepID=A0A9D2NQT6_9FIRM|nr:SdpI family protein [Candidatus Merdibacter merdavium]